ncbi:MAG: hypothetical protein N2049_01825 [Anaerolineales bacterium]|nr:hypothetical protein [Anaerolineales bacterium]MCX7607946.1 hypothetical protein [Anaerolineales bacterium]MDW8227884.1 hypothetical protein [Anaerolineales bacterium]
MPRLFRSVKRFFWLAALVLLVTIPITGVLSAALHWRGVCSDLHGGNVPCSWGRFAIGEMFWASFLFIPFLFVAVLVHLGMALMEFLVMGWRSILKRWRE